MKQGTPLNSHWEDIPYYYVEHWGEFSTALCINPSLEPQEHDALVRRIELDGCYLIHRILSHADVADFHSYLARLLPTVWGPAQDIARVALLLSCDPSIEWNPGYAERSAIARRFPCPILFHLTPDVDWKEWAKEHAFLLGHEVDLYPAALGTLDLADS